MIEVVIEVEWHYAIQLDITIFEDIDQGRGSNDSNEERRKEEKKEERRVEERRRRRVAGGEA